ncbi:MAG: ribonuclease PH [Nitrospirae bacterium]|nr:MAG: ribonuclease PH [Nitrospirota bacterium]
MRVDGRDKSSIRPVKIIKDFIKHAEGSVLIEVGDTKVICTATLEQSVPSFLKDQHKGWITAEYSMIPRATSTRTRRESSTGRVGGRTHEIQRLIGRAMRAVANLEAMPDITIWLDCDVIQADGGTRTASITGAFVAMKLAIDFAIKKGLLKEDPIIDYVAAISVGIVDGEILLDLNYAEDSIAEVDMNIVMTGSEKYVEIQGTAETKPFTFKEHEDMLALAGKGIKELISIQRGVLEDTNSYQK